MRALHAIFALLFGFAAYLNLNDPQPLPWIAIYLAAGVISALAFACRAGARPAAIATGVVALIWAATYVPAVLRHGQVLSMFDQWSMKNQDIVENRELFGLLIIAGWMAVVAATAGRRTRSSRTAGVR